MSGVPTPRLRGMALALDALALIERLLRSEARTVGDALGHESPIAKRLNSHAAYTHTILDQLKQDAAQAGEAQRAETTGSVEDEHAVPKGCAK